MVRELQDNLYQGRHVATPLNGEPDIVKIVQAYGIKAVFAESNEEAKNWPRKCWSLQKLMFWCAM